MIKHIVAFKLKNPDDAAEMKAHLMTLAGVVDGLRTWEIGINIGSSSQPYEVVVYSEFDRMEDLESFRTHPKHSVVKKVIAPFVETSGTIDYDAGR